MKVRLYHQRYQSRGDIVPTAGNHEESITAQVIELIVSNGACFTEQKWTEAT